MLEMHFGEHLTIDAYSCDYDKLNDAVFIHAMLDQLVDLLGMHKLSEPLVFRAEGGKPKDPKGGWSGFVIIEESHISIHTFLSTLFLSMDVYTCKNGLNQNLITDFVKQSFLPSELEINFLIRGKKYQSFF